MFLPVLDLHAPVKTVTIRNPTAPPVSTETGDLMARRRGALRVWGHGSCQLQCVAPFHWHTGTGQGTRFSTHNEGGSNAYTTFSLVKARTTSSHSLERTDPTRAELRRADLAGGMADQ